MTQPVKCSNCGALFGIQQDDGSLAIKYRDLFRQVRGSVSGPCRKCAALVEWPTPSVQPFTIPTDTNTTGVLTNGIRWTWVKPSPVYTCNCACSVCLSGSCCQNYTNTLDIEHGL